MKKIVLILFISLITSSSRLYSATLDISNASISPGSSANNSTTIKVSLTNKSNVDIKIYELTREKRILVRNLMNKDLPSKSSFKTEWDGRNDNGDVVGNGNYEIELVLSDIAKPFRKAVLKKEVRVETYYVIEELKFVPTPFSPRRETATIFYQLSKKAGVSLYILDSRKFPVIYIIRKKKADRGRNSVSWDGKDEEGWFLEAGSYICVLEVSVSGRTEKRKFPFRIVEGIEIRNLAVIPEKINPEGMNNYTTISFTTDKTANYSVKIFDAGGEEVWNSGINKGIAGKNYIVWGGLKKVSFKTNVHYKIKVRKKDKNGKTTEIIRHEKKIITEEMEGKNLKYKKGRNEGYPIIYSMAKLDEVSIPLAELRKKMEGVDGDIIEAEVGKVEILYTTVKPESLFSGKYTVEVNVKDSETREVSAPKTTTVTIDLEKPFGIDIDRKQIKGVNKKGEFFPKDISSSMNERFAEVIIPFRITKDANVKVRVISVKGGIEKEINLGRVLAGLSAARWDGMNQNDEPVSPGRYKIKILATDTVLVKKPKTIAYEYDIYVKKAPRVESTEYIGTNVFYAFDMEQDYLFPSPIISSKDIFDTLVMDLDKDKIDKEGRVTIDFKFSETVAIGCVVVGEENAMGTREIVQKKEWSGIVYSDKENMYSWSWNGRKFSRDENNTFLYKYGINEYEEDEKYVQSGLYQIWLFAVSRSKENETMLKNVIGELAKKRRVSDDKLQEFLENNIADKNIIFTKKELKGLGVFTEIGLHIEGAINKGIAEFIGYISKKNSYEK